MTTRPSFVLASSRADSFRGDFCTPKSRRPGGCKQEIGGEIVYFFHDSDHDPRETKTILRHRKNNEPLALNFVFDNRLQRKFSPLYLKRVLPEWHAKTAEQIRPFVEP